MSNCSYELETTIEVGDEETEVVVAYLIEPGQNGGRDDPSWEAYAEVESVKDVNGNELTVDTETMGTLTKRCNDKMGSDRKDAAEAYAEARYEELRDREYR